MSSSRTRRFYALRSLLAAVYCLSASLVSGQSALPTPWTAVDIGGPAMTGSTTYNTGVYTVTAGGTGVSGRTDQFHFVYRPVTGNVTIVARVNTLTPADPDSKAGLMVRGSLSANAANAFVYASGGNGVGLSRRTSDGGRTAVRRCCNNVAPVWLAIKREGDTVTGSRSADGTTWQVFASERVAMGQTIFVGIAVASRSRTQLALADISALGLPGGNSAPTVSLTSPSAGQTFQAPATIPLSATAVDSDGGVTRVDFYAGTQLIGTDNAAPFGATWSQAPAGSHSLTAVAWDTGGASTRSTAVAVTVSNSPPPPPAWVVQFTASADHATNLVTRYQLNIYTAGANTSTASPIATSDLGKPTPDAQMTIAVDRTTFINALSSGNYQATVAAVGPGGSTQSPPISFTR